MALSSNEAALAPHDSHRPPIFRSSSPLPIQHYTAELKRSSSLSRTPWVSVSQVVSVAFLAIVLVIQLIISSHVRIGTTFQDLGGTGASLDSVAICPNTPVLQEPLPISRPYKMALLEQARRVAAEFEYPPENVNKGVKEFIRQMGALKRIRDIEYGLLIGMV